MRKKITLALLSLLLVPLAMMAQDVTVRSDNGNLIPAVKTGGGSEGTDLFYDLKGYALWKHNQLNLTLTTADDDAADMENGQFQDAANNLFMASEQGFTNSKSLILGRGRRLDCYLAITLPKGYRFTAYRFVFRRNANVEEGTAGQATFGEVRVDDANEPIWNTYRPNANEEVYSVSGMSYSQSATRNRIFRTSKSDDDMGNTLYFKITNNQEGRVFLTLDTLKLEFTAEADYTPLNAGSKKYLNRTAVDIPFSTSTVDLGSVDWHDYSESTRLSYQNPTNLMANLQLFQEEGGTENGTNYDGTSGTVVKYADNGTISTEGNYFKIGKNDGQEHFYYIETPTYVQLNDYDKTKNPIGYRIVGAKINYTYGKARTNSETYTNTEEVIKEQKTYPTFTISCDAETYSRYWSGSYFGGDYVYESNGVQTYYLTSSAGMSTTETDKAVWFIDDDGYIRLANNASKYLKNQKVSGTNNRLVVVGSGDSPAKFAINANGQITLQANANMYLCVSVTNYRNTNYAQSVDYFQMISNGTFKATRTLTGENKVLNIYGTETETLVFPPFSPSNFTLKLYDKDGKVLAKTNGVEQSVEVKNGTADGYLEVNGLNNDAVKIGIIGVGLIDGSLTIQALDPYIDQMSVVCQDQTKPQIKLTQGFTASDFGMSGEDGGVFHFYLPKECAEDGDLVKITFEDLYSHYGDESYTNGSAAHTSRYNFVRSAHFDKLGLSNNWLYADTAEVAHPKLERLKVDMLGSKAYTFNNSATVGKNGGTLTEYPFTLEKYGAQGGTFDELKFTVSNIDQNQKKYVFTTDETAYNISPATATQHRTYAFYTFEVHVQSGTYEPKVEFVPIYKKGDDQGVTGTVYGNRQRDNFYGAVVTAVDGDGKPGFASTTEVNALIDKMITEDKEDSFGHTDIPDNANKLLYIDFSQLKGVYQTGDNQQLINKNAANCIIFVPEGAAGPVNNVAAKDGNVFKASRDIVLTDKQPFYIPYDIQVDAAQKAYYEREITTAHNGKVTSASIILPFAILVDDDGKHTNVDEDTWAFSLHEMKTNGNCLGGTAEDDAPAYAYFPAVSDVSSSQPNRPYIVKVNTENVPEGDNISFICSQAGALLKATTGMDKNDYTFKGTTSTGIDAKDGNKEMTFTYYGSYSGRLLPYDKYYYYYASNMFVRSNEYKYKTSIRVTPFRAFYATEGGAKARSLTSFDLFFGDEDTTDGIHAVENSWQGIDVNAPVYDLQGRKLADSLIGTTLKRGIYVINGQKFTVK